MSIFGCAAWGYQLFVASILCCNLFHLLKFPWLVFLTSLRIFGRFVSNNHPTLPSAALIVQVIRTATLQYGYLDHFKKVDRQLAPYILPMLCASWRGRGHAAALGWAAAQPALKTTIAEIEAEVSVCMCDVWCVFVLWCVVLRLVSYWYGFKFSELSTLSLKT